MTIKGKKILKSDFLFVDFCFPISNLYGIIKMLSTVSCHARRERREKRAYSGVPNARIRQTVHSQSQTQTQRRYKHVRLHNDYGPT